VERRLSARGNRRLDYKGMGRTTRHQRKGRGGIFKGITRTRVGAAKMRKYDFSEKNGFVKGVVKNIVHDPGRGAPLAQVEFRDQYKYKKSKEMFIAPEGLYSGQFIYCGTKAKLVVGNTLPIGKMPEGTIVCNVERNVGDRGKLARTSGNYATVIGHNPDENISRVKLPSGSKISVSSDARATIGLVAGGGRVDKPLLKAGANYHKFKVKRNTWPKVRGVAMNPIEHPHGGGNHQHIGHATTISRRRPAGAKVGLIAARRTGKLRGGQGKVK